MEDKPEQLPKYHRDGPFDDPIVRCTECQALILRTYLSKEGMCSSCGNRRFRNVSVLNPEEMKDLKAKKVDPEFLALFERNKDD